MIPDIRNMHVDVKLQGVFFNVCWVTDAMHALQFVVVFMKVRPGNNLLFMGCTVPVLLTAHPKDVVL